MEALLAHPAMQAGVLPFAAALAVVVITWRLGAVWIALSAVAAFAVALWLTVGFVFQPLTATRKIALLIIGATALGLIIDFLPLRRKAVNMLLAVVTIAAAWWVLWPALSRKELPDLLLHGGLLSAYVAWVTVMVSHLRADAVRSGAAGLALGLGTGVSAILGASALYGQLAVALSMACAALLLWLVVVRRSPVSGYGFVVPVATGLGLLGVGAVTFASLPLLALAGLALVPVAALVPVSTKVSVLWRGLIWAALGAVPAAGAVIYTWQTAGGSPY